MKLTKVLTAAQREMSDGVSSKAFDKVWHEGLQLQSGQSQKISLYSIAIAME